MTDLKPSELAELIIEKANNITGTGLKVVKNYLGNNDVDDIRSFAGNSPALLVGKITPSNIRQLTAHHDVNIDLDVTLYLYVENKGGASLKRTETDDLLYSLVSELTVIPKLTLQETNDFANDKSFYIIQISYDYQNEIKRRK